jgi:uncharacterized protein YdaU (DUF1376 family)
MNYYKFHIGDYRRDTSHLSLLEHGVYRQLLDWYYLDEKPIPLETQVVFRRLCGTTKEEKDAIEIILKEMFVETKKGYVQTRCLDQITEYGLMCDRNRDVGKLGGRPKKTNSDNENNHSGSKNNPNHKPLPITQYPLTNNHKPIKSKSKSKSKDLSTATRLPKNWELPKLWGEWAQTHNPSLTRDDVRLIADTFKDHWLAASGANARKMDWLATWRNWVRRNKTTAKPTKSFAEQDKERNDAKLMAWATSKKSITDLGS